MNTFGIIKEFLIHNYTISFTPIELLSLVAGICSVVGFVNVFKGTIDKLNGNDDECNDNYVEKLLESKIASLGDRFSKRVSPLDCSLRIFANECFPLYEKLSNNGLRRKLPLMKQTTLGIYNYETCDMLRSLSEFNIRQCANDIQYGRHKHRYTPPDMIGDIKLI